MENKENFKPVVLIVLDGWGYREEKEHNAIAEAKTPNFDRLWNEYPHTTLEASGLAVGLPEGQMGNSEVGHMTIGAGKIIDTDLVKISKQIASGEFAGNSTFKKLFDYVKENNSTLHVMGLIGPGGIHSHSEHLHAFIKVAKDAGVEKLAIHVFTDGRDTSPQSAHQYLLELENILQETGVGLIATATGRFYAMDRDNNWDRLERAEKALFSGEGKKVVGVSPSEAMSKFYEEGIVDEHLEPVVFLDENGQGYKIDKNDGVFVFNFRSDRARMITEKLLEKAVELNLCVATMTEYKKDYDILVAYEPEKIEATLASEVSKAGLTQAHIAETEKFAHATFFLNGGQEVPHASEKHILIESRKDVPTHDLAPEMKAIEIAEKAVEEIKAGTNFIFVNIANADMVGHTARREAVIRSLEVADEALGKIVNAVEEVGGVAFITADHGNAEIGIDNDGQPHTAHTTNPVPFIITNKELKLVASGTLADIAPTVLSLLDLPKPEVMTGNTLVR